jgi:AraC-like DNA-binding protein
MLRRLAMGEGASVALGLPDDVRALATAPSRDHPLVRDASELLGYAANGWVVVQDYPEPLERDLHQAFEVAVVLSGQQDRISEGFPVRLRAGELCLIPGWETHGWHTMAPGTYVFVLHFLPEFLGEDTLEGRSWLSLFVAPVAARPRVKTPQMKAEVLSLVYGLSRETAHRRPGWLTAVRLGLLQLLFLVSRDWAPVSAGSGRAVQMRDRDRISPAVDLVDRQPGRRTALVEAAAACSLSVSQFSLLFRRAMGMSFGRFAARSRLVQAAQLLASTDLTLAAVADRLGFADASHFLRSFVKHYGCTPALYRARGESRRSQAQR